MAEQLRHGAKVVASADDRDLQAKAPGPQARQRALQLLLERRGNRVGVGVEDRAGQENVAGRIAVGAGGGGQHPGADQREREQSSQQGAPERVEPRSGRACHLSCRAARVHGRAAAETSAGSGWERCSFRA